MLGIIILEKTQVIKRQTHMSFRNKSLEGSTHRELLVMLRFMESKGNFLISGTFIHDFNCVLFVPSWSL